MLLVGLTGGMGAGKSTVARMLARRGAEVVDADKLARLAVAPGTPGYDKVVELFGPGAVTAAGELDREAVAGVVFADAAKRAALESIVHPEVFRLLAERVEGRQGTDAIVVFDAALIVETGFHEACDVVVVVTAPEEDRVRRVMRARGMSEAAARERVAAQIASSRREAHADVVVRNDEDLAALERRVDELWERLERRREARPAP
ncbi:MAG: dephospho-CoA kinase [Actinomycetota bacterium]|nr:dephospho-CoA kinase [Actinomycetota bacterium]